MCRNLLARANCWRKSGNTCRKPGIDCCSDESAWRSADMRAHSTTVDPKCDILFMPDVVLGAGEATSSKRRREILLQEGVPSQHARPIRSETWATLVAAIARGRRWLDELTTDASISGDSCSVRKVNMTISLAFLAPDLIKAAIEWPAVARHRRCPSHRLACRMVKAARDAWLSVALTQHSNLVSTNASLHRRETRFCETETKAPKPPSKFQLTIAETKCVHESPPVRGYLRPTAKSLFV
jgi:hypothetical protein